MEQRLIEYILETYKPAALVLHGSRATGNAIEGSDWDFILFMHEGRNLHREMIFGESVELIEAVLPIPEDKIIKRFCPKLAASRIKFCYDLDGIAKHIADVCQKTVDAGMHVEAWEFGVQRQILEGLLGKIRRYANEPIARRQYEGQFVERSLEWWFWNKNGTYSLPPYNSLPLIQEKDPAFYEMMKDFISSTGDVQAAGSQIVTYLCPR